MKFLKKIWAWEKAQMRKPETHLAIGMVGGMLIGVGMGNVGAGIALGVALGVPGYVTCKKKVGKKEEKLKLTTNNLKTPSK